MALILRKTHNVAMESHQPTETSKIRSFRRHPISTAVALLALLGLGACGEAKTPKKQADTEIEHCIVAMEKLSKDLIDVSLVDARAWDVEKIKNVSLTFDYTTPAKGTAIEAETFRGLMVCRYEYSREIRTTKGHEAKALAIRFRGRQLSDNELLLLNASISGVKSRLQWPK